MRDDLSELQALLLASEAGSLTQEQFEAAQRFLEG
jgi:hypothetical protein